MKPRVCTEPGCPTINCTVHSHGSTATRTRQPDGRSSAATRGYDTTWRRLRQLHLHAHPVCAVCGATASRAPLHIDHIVPVFDDPERRLDPNNLQTLCQACHNRKTRAEQGRGGRELSDEGLGTGRGRVSGSEQGREVSR